MQENLLSSLILKLAATQKFILFHHQLRPLPTKDYYNAVENIGKGAMNKKLSSPAEKAYGRTKKS